MRLSIRDIYHFFRYDIPYGISNLVKWFPVIWKDRDWDYCFFLTILHKKLCFMEELFEYNAHYVGSEKDARIIKICRILSERLVRDDYIMSLAENKVFYRREPEVWKHEDALRDQDRDYLFKLMQKHLFKWWD